MNEPNDRELEQYLKGESPLSKRYRDASGETTPPDLDEAILARARAEARRKPPSLNRLLAPFAVAASVLVGVNLAWNVWQVAPQPEAPVLAEKMKRDDAFVPDPASPPPQVAAAPEPAPQAKARQAPPPVPVEPPADKERDAALAARQEDESRDRLAKAEEGATAERKQAAEAMRRENYAAGDSAPQSAGAVAQPAPSVMAPAAGLADGKAPLSEGQKIDHLVEYIRTLQGATFVRNGKDYGPAEAAKHLQLKREKAGDRCDTADEFIRTCASFSSTSGEAYLIRFADGRTRTAEDVLREELARISAAD